ncbi:S41 family peptidase [Oceanirhabdus seepicola]|uniref:Tail specific protease domain-containing protein n=1 Tax=Oceanirhabdus seepicola TaxID=2828781 RepID=A0A9J6PA08_9CLOT|nr:S41 family peptidase [Oceanirhabdus seepicola]MCM1992245.1 hypothetical protein [Oceanirhabdus seepicola]
MKNKQIKRKKGLKIVLGLFLILGIVGSISIHFINKDSKTFINLTEQQKLEDYEYLWSTLRESYPFMGVAQRSGIDVEEIYEKYKTEIIKSKTDIDFAKTLNCVVNEFNGIGHLSMIDGKIYKNFKDTYSQFLDSDKEAKKGYDRWLDAFKNSTTQKTYSLLDDKKHGFRTTKHLKKRKEDNKEVKTDTSSVEQNIKTEILQARKVAYVNIKSFQFSNIKSDKEKLFKFYDEVSNCPNLIIDLRENSGGSDYYWKELIVAPNIKEEIAYNHYSLLKLSENNRPYLEGVYNEEDIQPISKLPNFKNINPEDVASMSNFVKDEYVISPNKSSRTYKGKIWVLTSPKIYSTSEVFTMFCKSTDFATLVGTETGGDGGAVDPIFIALKNSGFMFRYSMLHSLNLDGKSNEEFGTSPHIRIKDGEDALQVCLDAID